MKLSNVKIGARLKFGFGILVMSTLMMGIYSIIQFQNLSQNTTDMFEHPYTINIAVRDIEINLLSMVADMKVGLSADNIEEESSFFSQVDHHENNINELFKVLESQFLGDKEDIKNAYDTFIKWNSFRKEIRTIKLSGNKKLALEKTNTNGDKLVDELLSKINIVVDFAGNKGIEFYKNATLNEENSIIWLAVFFLCTFIAGIILSLIITYSITNPLKSIVTTIEDFSEGKFASEIKYNAKDELGILSDSLKKLQNDLLIKAEVANAIAVGDFSKTPQIHSNEDIVSIALNKVLSYLREIVLQATLISEGNIRSEITLKSDNDNLGMAINKMVESLKEVVSQADKIANGNYSSKLTPKSKEDLLSISLNKMTNSLNILELENNRQNWIKTGQTELSNQISGIEDLTILSKKIITFVTKYLGAQIGALYIKTDSEKELLLTAGYAYTKRKDLNNKVKYGEGLVGQAAVEMEIISITNVPDDYIRINSALGDTLPKNLIVVPLKKNNELEGVIELGSINEFNDTQLEFLNIINEYIGVAISSAKSRNQLEILLNETNQQSETLKIQQEELKATNEELEEQTEKLTRSEIELKNQREELQASNEELEEKSLILEKNKDEITIKNKELEETQKILEKRAEEIAITSKYKSEFLANMSHELRTPLNSLLILSQDLAANKKDNLNDDQVQSAEIIYKSGNDLLNLINDILDLSKIEAGKMTVNSDEIKIADLSDRIFSEFYHVTENKGLKLSISVGNNLPGKIISDNQKLTQIIRNLISNAIKFTENGEISVTIDKPQDDVNLHRSKLDNNNALAICIKDNGIGIETEKLNEIFEAFQQGDGSTSRRYGGTGLGLSISRELTRLLGGEIQVNSKINEGSTFILYIPFILDDKTNINSENRIANFAPLSELPKPKIIEPKSFVPSERLKDDLGTITSVDKSILVIEDDLGFAKVLQNFCHEKEFKFIHAGDGITGIKLAKENKPDAIILDIRLPGIEGWGVLEALKDNVETRHIPIHMMSADDETIDVYKKGAIGYLTKPINSKELENAFDKINSVLSKKMKNLLIIEDDENLRTSILKLIGNGDVKSFAVGTGKEALNELTTKLYDCIILDLKLPDMTGFNVLEEMSKAGNGQLPPVIIYTGKEITRDEELELQKYASSIIIKGVKSQERLLDETALFLHRVVENLPDNKKKMIKMLHDKDMLLASKKVLVVDDDMRNVFAISKILEEKGMKVIKASNGKKALESLEENESIDIVLMDIMMPVMDGYETMKAIRNINKYWKLPIIALTAKAMKEDREKCIEAGANDYMPKPVNIERLLSLLRVWLYK